MSELTDRELLELAAKAVGFELGECAGDDFAGNVFYNCYWPNGRHFYWNPLTDDGDALRLAGKLRLDVHMWSDGDTSCAPAGTSDESDEWILEDGSADPYAATRRAITRAAAEIGKSR